MRQTAPHIAVSYNYEAGLFRQRGYSDKFAPSSTAIFLPRQGSTELLWYHRTGWLTTMHNSYFSSWYHAGSYMYVDCRNCPISIIANHFLLFHKFKTLGSGDCSWCSGTRQYYPAVERIPTSFVKERLYRKVLNFLSELPRILERWAKSTKNLCY